MLSNRQSALLSIFLPITMLFDITIARSYFMRGGLAAIAALYAVIATLKLALPILEEMPKRNLLYSDEIRDNAGTEGFSGFWNRSMLIWVTRLVVKGSHQHLKVEDLPPIGQQDNPEQLYNRFTPFWDTLAAATISKSPLIRAGVRTLYREFLSSILPRLCLVGFSFARPFLMQWTASAVVRFCSLKRSLIGATILIFWWLVDLKSNFRATPISSKDLRPRYPRHFHLQ
ncbi:hypothetical protein BB8028_0001g14250 [Beauveria bassiana]|uniref:Uncharacterized protein n=1 Tax=Beauveria bassiana TaxID=176275 RepID=A0A2S7XZL9_BEABA|nr:hypothetical protein BB8028_0001g14250 [Beauveria bassiana]